MTFDPGDVVTIDFPGVTGTKRRPAIVLSSVTYYANHPDVNHPDVIVGLITTQTRGLGLTDYVLQEWEAAGLRAASVFRSFIVTLPPSANLICIDHLPELDWRGVQNCVKIALAEVEDTQPLPSSEP